ncbi:MAG: SH3 domain-containing protein [Rhizobiales bacterium]|nr:SH3 domain-containing protein [Hyphomicrobiales bacterium]NRB13625.1 SH3 domain-containing protein [Hyphomicrobiales bacterium]
MTFSSKLYFLVTFTLFFVAFLTPIPPFNPAADAHVTAQIDIVGYKYISKNSVNVRALPNVHSQKVGNLKLNTRVAYFAIINNWYQIFNPSTQQLGWVLGSLLADQQQNISVKPAPLSSGFEPIRPAYYGTCDCPYDRASNGSRCGGRSAYSRPGGRSPICYK